MNSFSWMIRRYTGASVELSADELKQIETRCNEMFASQQRRFWIIILLTVFTTALAASFGGRLVGIVVSSWTGWPEPWCRGGGSIVIAIMSTAMWLYIYTRMYVRPLRRALTELGYPVCERCGYSLRELPAETVSCPECGAARILRYDKGT